MGSYLIPGATVLQRAIDHVRFQSAGPTVAQTWDPTAEGGILFTDTSRDDTACAALYTGFVDDGSPYVRPLPDAVRTHLQHLRDYLNASSPTNAETVHVVKDLIRAVHYLNNRFENEG